MKTFDKILIAVTSTFCFLSVVFAFAAIVVPDFRDNGGNIVLIILGAFTTMAGSILTGSYFARDIKSAPKDEVRREEESKSVDRV